MPRFLPLLAGLLIALSLAGCSGNKPQQLTSDQRPLWIDHPPHQSGRAYGVGSAEVYGSQSRALQTAREQAIANLLAGIRATFSSQTDISRNAEMRSDGSLLLHDQLQQQLRTQVQAVELPGIQVAETWTRPDGREIWVLAELDRLTAEQQLLQSLNQLDQRMLARGLPASGSKLERLQYLAPTLKELVERQQLLEPLVFLGAENRVDATQRRGVEQLDSEIRRLLASLTLTLQTADARSASLAPEVAAALTRAGFTLVGQGADLQLFLSLDSTQVARNRLHHVDARAQGQLSTPEGQTLQAVNETYRGTSSDPGVAESLAIQGVAEQLSQRLIGRLYQQP